MSAVVLLELLIFPSNWALPNPPPRWAPGPAEMPWKPFCSQRRGRKRLNSWQLNSLSIPSAPLHGWGASCKGITHMTFLKSLSKHQAPLPAEVKHRKPRQEFLEFCVKFYPSTPPLLLHPRLLKQNLVCHDQTPQEAARSCCHILPHPRFGAGSSLHPLYLLLLSPGPFGNRAVLAAQGMGMCLLWQ